MRMSSRSRMWIGIALVTLLTGGSVALLSSPNKDLLGIRRQESLGNPSVGFALDPGVVLQITGYQIAASNALTVNYQLTDPQGNPLDVNGVQSAGAVSVRFILAYLPAGQPTAQYIPLTLTKNSSVPGDTVTQPSTDTGGKNVQNADGTYSYTFGTLVPATVPAGSTLTVGATASRDLTELDQGTSYANTTFSFVPGGGTPEVREVVTNADCNKCHSQIAFHGGSRRSTALCILCHVPGYVNPQTGNSIDLKVMVHKIHMGSSLPSVVAGGTYEIFNSHGTYNYSPIVFPAKPNTCVACHAGDAQQATAYLTRPAMATCGSCHDNVNFATGANHPGGVQVDDTKCATCHIPQGDTDFDASITGAHVNPDESTLLPGIVGNIVSVTNTAPGQSPVVAFTLVDKTGATIPMSAFSQTGYRLAFVLAGPTTDYVGLPPHGYISENPVPSASLNGDTYTYTFTATIPANATGTYSIGMEGRRNDTVLAGTSAAQTIEYGMQNVVSSFSVDGSPVVPRRSIVARAECNQCHHNLTAHGENRNQIEMCVLCHNPLENDSAYRPASANPPESVDFALMIHRIHSGPSQTRNFTIWGYGNSQNNFNNVLYPGDLTNCAQCHLPGTNNVPAKAVAKINDTRGYIDPVYPTTGACLGCHALVSDASHALANTTPLGESCAICHGPSGAFAVGTVHSSAVRVESGRPREIMVVEPQPRQTTPSAVVPNTSHTGAASRALD